MNCTKQLTLTGYRVRYADLREPKPRTIREEVQIMDAAFLTALGLTGQNPADFIEQRFTRGGFHVVSVEKLGRRSIALDLFQLWESQAVEGEAE